MNYDNLQSSFRRTGQYEAAGTLWMLDPVCHHDDSVSDESVTISQIDAARWQWDIEGEATHVWVSGGLHEDILAPLPSSSLDLSNGDALVRD